VQEHTERLGYAPIGKLLVSLSLPSIAALITTSLYNIVDTFWVAKLGHEAIAALSIVFPYQILFYSIGSGTGIGIGALVSRRFGENNIEATNHAAGQIFFLSALWGLLFMLFTIFFSGSILSAIGATPDIMEYSNQYLVIVVCGAPQIIFVLIASNLVRASGDAVKPMVMMIVACVTNIILDPFMILGIGPFPEMGVRGAALATVIAQSCGAFLGLYYLFSHKTAFRVKAGHLKPDVPILRDIYRVGASAMILQITESLSFILFNRVVSSFGSIAIAALGMAMRVADIAYMPIIGLSNGLLPIVGFNFGTQNFKRLWHSVKLATLSIFLLLAVFTLLIETLAPQIIGIFSDEPELLAATIPTMRITLSTLALVGPTILFITTFQGLSMGTMALVLSLIRWCILFVPPLYILSRFFGLYGAWWSLPISDALSFILTFIFIYLEYKKRKSSIAEPDFTK
jgi:putative MATE family efflux protein